MRINRRKALALFGLGAATPAMAAASGKVSFKHGVASGDPLAPDHAGRSGGGGPDRL
jgi:alkaline phosphatase D